MSILHRPLSKTRFVAGLQCPRRLWLQVYQPQPYDEPEPGSPIGIGIEVGLKARLLFPGGVAVVAEPWEHAQAVARTASLMADPTVPAIFEAAFEQDGVHVRVDVLERLGNGSWGMREVKASSRLKDHYLDEIALQAHVLKRARVALSSIELIHINSSYVRRSNGIDWSELFNRVDVTEEITALMPDVPDNLMGMHEAVRVPIEPAVEPGWQCASPYPCEFWDRCTAEKPEDWIAYLPGRTQKQADELAALGIEAISAIPSDFPLNARQTIIRDALVSGIPFVASDLAHRLSTYGPPVRYLDFEAMMPPIPLYEGTRPYQSIVFQWSLHTLEADGELHHQEFLADHDADPRRRFAETLVETLGECDLPIIVYSGYEQTRLRELAAAFPDLAEPLQAIRNRLIDLLPIVRSAIYFPAAGFGNSIKDVAPALCPEFGYDDLEGIADGQVASAAFWRLASRDSAALEQIDRLRSALLAYCHRDTLAMVEVHRALMRFAEQRQADTHPQFHLNGQDRAVETADPAHPARSLRDSE